MKKSLIKITFKKPEYIEQGGGVVKALFIITNKIKHLSTKIYYQCDEGYLHHIEHEKIDKIEFIKPTDL